MSSVSGPCPRGGLPGPAAGGWGPDRDRGLREGEGPSRKGQRGPAQTTGKAKAGGEDWLWLDVGGI